MNLFDSSPTFFKIVFLLWFFFPSLVFANEELIRLNHDSNVGLIKNVPKELHEALPMCDEFLDVHWIRAIPGKKSTRGEPVDDTYWVGRVVVDIILADKSDQRELVVLEDKRRLGRFKIFDITTSNYRGKRFDELIMAATSVNKFYFPNSDTDYSTHGLTVYKDNSNILICKGYIGSQSYLENGIVSRLTRHSNKLFCIIHPQKKRWLIKREKSHNKQERFHGN